MKIFILTQEDAFYIPKLIAGFMQESDEIEVVGAAILKGEIARKNVGSYFDLLGFSGFLKTGFFFAMYKAADVLDGVFSFKSSYSVARFFEKKGVAIFRPSSINSQDFHGLMRELGVELIVSIACPQIVRKELMSIPSEGVINIHGALLPKYRGKLPSFWVLANDEKVTGVTVHFMNEKLDDGPIIIQKEVPIEAHDTLHSLILKSKVSYGAQALAEAVHHILSGSVQLRSNDASQATYFSFPTAEAIARFRKLGRKIR